jgi:predicted phage-related endonuclease
MIDRIQHLKDRKSSIGASDVSSVLRIPGAPRGPLDVYLDKITPEISDFDNKAMKVGRIVEAGIANLYEIETGRPVDDLGSTVIQRHPDYPWIASTLDRVTAEEDSDPRVPLELKHVARYDCTPEDWEVEPLFCYQAQVNIQMFCTMAQWGSLAGMFMGYKLAYKDMEINHNFIDFALPKLERPGGP